jgi:hypothetical protein
MISPVTPTPLPIVSSRTTSILEIVSKTSAISHHRSVLEMKRECSSQSSYCCQHFPVLLSKTPASSHHHSVLETKTGGTRFGKQPPTRLLDHSNRPPAVSQQRVRSDGGRPPLVLRRGLLTTRMSDAVRLELVSKTPAKDDCA